MIGHYDNDAGVRRTALLLHTLAPADRISMLASFTPDQRQTLNTLLDELSNLGIPRDRALLEQTISALPSSEASSAAPDFIRLLQAAPAQDIVRVLEQEPAELIARLLSCAQWTWSAELLGALDPLRRRQVQSSLHCIKQPSSRLGEALMRAVHASWLALEAPTRDSLSAPRRWQGPLERLRHLIGART